MFCTSCGTMLGLCHKAEEGYGPLKTKSMGGGDDCPRNSGLRVGVLASKFPIAFPTNAMSLIQGRLDGTCPAKPGHSALSA